MGQRGSERARSDIGPGGGAPDVIDLRDDDGLLVDDLRRGSESAFAFLVDRYQAPMLRVARFYVGSQASAEDVVQETWLAVFRGVDRFDGRSTLKTWLFRILTNRAKTAGQREGRTIVLAELAGCGAPGHGSQVVADGSLDRSSSWAAPPEHLHRPAEDHVLATRSSPSCRRRHRRVAARAASGHHPPRVDCWSARGVCVGLGLSDTNQRVLLHRARAQVRHRLASYFADEPIES